MTVGKSTSFLGDIVHAAIQFDYCLQHPRSLILADKYLLRTGNQSQSLGGFMPARSPSLLLSNSTEPQADMLRTALSTGRPNEYLKPDILDVTQKDVYEIKPWTQAGDGLLQLTDYLIRGLIRVAMGDAAAARLLQSLEPTSLRPSGSVFMPGTWEPRMCYIILLDQMTSLTIQVERPVPGLILYSVFTRKRPTDETAGARTQVGALIVGGAVLAVALSIAIAPEAFGLGVGAEAGAALEGIVGASDAAAEAGAAGDAEAMLAEVLAPLEDPDTSRRSCARKRR